MAFDRAPESVAATLSSINEVLLEALLAQSLKEERVWQ
jgi:hypothetical protein